MSSADSNLFERRRDKLAARITQRQERVNAAFGVGNRPYGAKVVTDAEAAEIAAFKAAKAAGVIE